MQNILVVEDDIDIQEILNNCATCICLQRDFFLYLKNYAILILRYLKPKCRGTIFRVAGYPVYL